MLRKRTRSLQKDQQMDQLTMSDSGSGSHLQSHCVEHIQANSFFGVPGLFVGLSSKGLSDSDSIRSPTSPLEFRVFSNLGNLLRSPHNGHQKNWNCSKVGLSIIDSLDDDMKGSDQVLRSTESKNILFGPQVRVKTPKFQAHTNYFEAPKSLPRNFAIFPRTLDKSSRQKGNSDVLFEIGEARFEPEPLAKIRSCSLDSCRSFSTLSRFANRSSKNSSENIHLDDVTTQVNSPLQFSGGSPKSNNFLHKKSLRNSVSIGSGSGFDGSLSASEIELSEDYTCVISHGPNPKKTHIYGDCILECHSNDASNVGKNEGKGVGLPQAAVSSTVPGAFPSNHFLSFCYYCNKKLEEGKDIYMYRGEKAFCSLICRSQEIVFDEELEGTVDKSSEDSPKLDNGEELFESGIFDAP